MIPKSFAAAVEEKIKSLWRSWKITADQWEAILKRLKHYDLDAVCDAVQRAYADKPGGSQPNWDLIFAILQGDSGLPTAERFKQDLRTKTAFELEHRIKFLRGYDHCENARAELALVIEVAREKGVSV